MTFQPIQAILQVPVSPGNPPHSSILQLECIFYKQFYSSIGFHKNSTEYQLDNTNYKHYILQRKGDVVILVNLAFSRIELRVKVKRLIARMTFNSFLSCLMSEESMEITINTSKWHERAKQWNGNSHISSHKLACSHFIVILFTTQCQLYI